jgi:hypothetical protein
MTTGFGSCPTCGTPKVASDQAFCAICGASFVVAPPPAPPAWPSAAQPPAAPPAWPSAAQPPAPQFGAPPTYQSGADYQPGYQQGYQPGYQQGYQEGYQPGYPGYPGYAPAAKSNTGLIAAICIIVGVVAVVALLGGLVLMSGSRSGSAGGASPSPSHPIVTPSPTPAATGSIVYTPSTIGCGDAYTLVIRLPASVYGSDRITVKYDGITEGTQTVSSGFVKQKDGSWLYQDSTGAGGWSCGSSGSSSVGTHTETIVDSSGTVLAEGTYTLTY